MMTSITRGGGEYLLHFFEFADDKDEWFEEVKIAGQAVVFKLDTRTPVPSAMC
jgi:hypothetical protein